MKKMLLSISEVIRYFIFGFLPVRFFIIMLWTLPIEDSLGYNLLPTIEISCFALLMFLYPRKNKASKTFSNVILFLVLVMVLAYSSAVIQDMFTNDLFFVNLKAYLYTFFINIVWIIICCIVINKLNNEKTLNIFTTAILCVLSYDYFNVIIYRLVAMDIGKMTVNRLGIINSFDNVIIEVIYMVTICLLIVYSIILINKRKTTGIYLGIGIYTFQALSFFGGLFIKDIDRELIVKNVLNGILSVGVIILLIILKRQWENQNNKKSMVFENSNTEILGET